MLIQNYGVTPRSSTMMKTMKNYLIRDLSQKTQLSTDTIRFYEKKGFIITGSYDFPITATHTNPNHRMFLEF